MLVPNLPFLADMSQVIKTNLEVGGVEECPQRPDAGLPPAKPLLDGRLREADGHRETHLPSKQRLGVLADLWSLVVNVSAQLDVNLCILGFI